MLVVVQRVARAAVLVEGRAVARIERGVALLACAVSGDTPAEVDWLAEKLAGLRIFEDAQGLTNLALLDVGGAVLLVPQFTLAADWRKGRRPSFTAAARPEETSLCAVVVSKRPEAACVSDSPVPRLSSPE